MSDSQQRGNRLGPYQLEARYRNTGHDLGRLYRARNEETGAPAVVVQHTAQHPWDAPVADWTVRLSSSVSPAYLALEVESAPSAAEAGEELDCMLEHLHAAVNHLVTRPETLRHLRSGRRPAPRPRTDWRPGVFGGALAAALALLIIRSTPTASPGLEGEYTRAQFALAVLDAGVGDLTGSVLTDTTRTMPIALARPMPKRPFAGKQKLPPCDQDVESEVYGGCWVATDKVAPCPDKLYEHEGKCYLPAAPASRDPASIFR